MDILVVEDERKLAKALAEGLEADGYTVRVAHTGEEGYYLIHAQTFDLAILDVMLPGHDGFEILLRLRHDGIKTPVLLLTARDAIEDRVHGLDLGADDYLVKPFAFPELLARIRVLLRRGQAPANRRLELDDLEMDLTRHFVQRNGEQIDLTLREFELLEYLFANQGRVVSREMLVRDVWKEGARHTPLDNVIDVQMARLRRKIDGKSEHKLLHTVRGVGYALREEDK